MKLAGKNNTLLN